MLVSINCLVDACFTSFVAYCLFHPFPIASETHRYDGKAKTNLSAQPDVIATMAEVRQLTNVEPQLLRPMKTKDGNQEISLQEDSEYQLIEKSNQLVTKLDVEILNIYSFIRDLYSQKFPELESIVFSPLEYIASVQLIKNDTDLTMIDLSNVLPSTVTMAVTVASSMTTGQPLSDEKLAKILDAGKIAN